MALTLKWSTRWDVTDTPRWWFWPYARLCKSLVVSHMQGWFCSLEQTHHDDSRHRIVTALSLGMSRTFLMECKIRYRSCVWSYWPIQSIWPFSSWRPPHHECSVLPHAAWRDLSSSGTTGRLVPRVSQLVVLLGSPCSRLWLTSPSYPSTWDNWTDSPH